MLGEQALDIQASTFHSACMRILRREITALGYERSFTVYDTDDSVRIIKEALKELAIQEKVMAPKGILASISAAKDQLLSPEDVLREAKGDYRQEVVGKVYSYYQKRLKAANALDFDDIIIFTVKIFQQYPDVLEKYRTVSATSWWTSIRTPTTPNFCWSACWRADIRTSAWSATTTRASTSSAAPPSRTS